MAGDHRTAARLRHVADEQAGPAVERARVARQPLEIVEQLRRAPVAVAREAHHLPVWAVDRERDAAGEAASCVGADGARGERGRRAVTAPNSILAGGDTFLAASRAADGTWPAHRPLLWNSYLRLPQTRWRGAAAGGRKLSCAVSSAAALTNRSRKYQVDLERPRRSQRDGEQGRAEEKDQGRAAERTNRPNGFGEGAAPATEFSASSREPSASVASAATVMGSPDRHGESVPPRRPRRLLASARRRARGSRPCTA